MASSCTSLIVYNNSLLPHQWRDSSSSSSSRVNEVGAVTAKVKGVAKDSLSLLPQAIRTKIILLLPIREIAYSARVSCLFNRESFFNWRMLPKSHPNAIIASTNLLSILEKSISSEYLSESGIVFNDKRVVENIPRDLCPFKQIDILSRFLITHATDVHHNQEFEVSGKLWQHEYVISKILQLSLENKCLVTAQFIMDTIRPILASHPFILNKIRELPNIELIRIN